MSDINHLSCGRDHLCIINESGNLTCKDVMLGTPKAVIPTKVKKERDVRVIATGMNSTSTISKSGSLQFW